MLELLPVAITSERTLPVQERNPTPGSRSPLLIPGIVAMILVVIAIILVVTGEGRFGNRQLLSNRLSHPKTLSVPVVSRASA